MNIFDKINHAIRGTEASFVNLISAIGPWLAPLAPAYMAYYHMVDVLLFPRWVAFSIALVIEFLGLATISTILAFWNHNQRNRNKKDRVSILVPVVTFLFYLAIILSLNVLLELDIPGMQKTIEIIARAMLTLLSVPAALILAARTMQYNLLAEIEQSKAERKQKVSETKRTISEPLANLPAYQCELCGFVAKTQNALNGHMRKHSKIPANGNGHSKEKVIV